MADTKVRRRVLTGAAAVVITAVAVGGYVYATDPSGPNLRLATAEYADVSQTLTSTGTIEPINQAAVNFPVSGRVASVSVTAGQQVTAGQPLAALNTTGLTAQLATDQAAVATAEARLSTDETADRTPVTPQQLVADQSNIDAARAVVDVARQNLAQAELTSPIAGTVGQVALTPGQEVATAPSTPEITIIGAGGSQVTTTIDAAVAGEAKVGDQVQVTPDGSQNALTGRVLAIGVLPTNTDYPVTIALDDPTTPLPEGGGANVSIRVASATHVLTVPTSAVTLTRTGATVEVLKNGTQTPVRVAIGATGPERTQIKSGLNAGDQVILANLSQPMPTTTNTGRGTRNLL
jgi:RND family efflux transporter MFP subunit